MLAQPQISAYDMLKPTLENPTRKRVVMVSPITHAPAVIPLHENVGVVELGLACLLHAALDRGLLVLA